MVNLLCADHGNGIKRIERSLLSMYVLLFDDV